MFSTALILSEKSLTPHIIKLSILVFNCYVQITLVSVNEIKIIKINIEFCGNSSFS